MSSICDFYEVEKIVGKRTNPNTHQVQYLVKWKGYPSEENTWEPCDHLEQSKKLIDEFEKLTYKGKRTVKTKKAAEPLPTNGNKNDEKEGSPIEEKQEKQEKKNGLKHEGKKIVLDSKYMKSYFTVESEDLEVIGMGSRDESILFQVKAKEEIYWVSKDVLLPKYSMQLIDFYEKNLVVLQN